MNMRQFRRRKGFTLVDVALAIVILSLGVLGSSRFFTSVYEELSPQANGGGLRRFILAETALKAQAEALRATQFTWPDNSTGQVMMVTMPPNSGLTFNLTMGVPITMPTTQYLFYDFEVRDQGRVIATLSMSTLRAFSGGLNAKIGL
jgi:hypothetical protein